MERPNDELLKLYRLGTIHGLFIEQRETGTDTVDTFCTVVCAGVQFEAPWPKFSRYLDVSVRHNSVAEIKDPFMRQCDDWEKFKEDNEAEWKAYKRLYRKFNGCSVS